MTINYKLDGILLPYETVRLNTDAEQGTLGLPSSAWYGEPSTAGVQIDDVAGSLDIDGWHTFTVDETACVGAERIFTGWIFGKNIGRGPYRLGASRVWDCDIIDQNALFSFEVFRAKSAQRPAESDLVRAAYFQASAPMSGTPAYDNGRFNVTDNPVNFGDSNYVTQYPAEGFTSIAATAGKNFYAYYDDSANQISLHYDQIANAPASTLRISNVLADYDGTTTFYPQIDGTLNRTPDAQYTGVLFGYGGGYEYGRRQLTIDALNPTNPEPLSVQFRRDLVYRTDRVNRAATAAALVQSILVDRSGEADAINCTVPLPASKVNLIHAGMAVDCKFSHLPGYEAFTSLPVIRRNVVPTAELNGAGELMYDVHLELTNAVAPRGPGGGDPTDFPPVPDTCDVADVVIVQSEHDEVTSPASNPAVNIAGSSWPAPPTAGNLLVCAWMSFGQQTKTPGTMTGWTQIAAPEAFTGTGGSGGAITVYWKIAEASEDTTPLALGGDFSSANLVKSNQYLIEVAGVGAIDEWNADHSEVETTTPGFTLTPTAGTTGIVFTFQEIHSNAVGTINGGETVLYVEGNVNGGGNPGHWVAYEAFDNVAGAVDVNRHFSGFDRSWTQLSVAFICSASDPDAPCVVAGQPSPEDEPVTPAPDGVETTFNTRCPFADGTLHVYVDNTDQTGAITSYDGAAGEFTLGFAPTMTERITAFYLGR